MHGPVKHVEFLTQGIYTPSRAGALAGVSGQRLGQWARHELIRPSAYKGRPTNLYSYFDVAEAVAVNWLRSEGFKYDEIHSAIRNARQTEPMWPLTRSDLGVARQDLEEDPGMILKREGDIYVDVTRAGDQVALKPTFLFHVSDTLRSGGWIARELGLERIEVDPGRLGGRPSLKGRRWAVQHVALIADDEAGRAALVENYDLEPDEIDECVKWSEAADALQPA